jgi:hypothetical protein
MNESQNFTKAIRRARRLAAKSGDHTNHREPASAAGAAINGGKTAKTSTRNVPLMTLSTPRLFSIAISRARRLAKKSGRLANKQAHASTLVNSRSLTDDESNQELTRGVFPGNNGVTCKRPRYEESESHCERLLYQSRHDNFFIGSKSTIEQPSSFQVPPLTTSIFLQSDSLDTKRVSQHCLSAPSTTSAFASGIILPGHILCGDIGYSSDLARCPMPVQFTFDLLQRLAPIAQSLPSPAAVIFSPIMTQYAPMPSPCPLAHGVDMQAFLQGASWAAGPCNPSWTDLTHSPPLINATPPYLPSWAQIFPSAGPAQKPGSWIPVTARAGAAPPCPAFWPFATGR